jgi:hypothetical protein
MNFRAWKVGVSRGRLILLSNQKSNRAELLVVYSLAILLSNTANTVAVRAACVLVL